VKIVVIGGAGLMGPTIVRDLSESPAVEEILVADCQEEKAKELAASFNDSRIKASFLDASSIEETASLIKSYDVVINSALYYVNVSTMKACLKAGCNYNDLGGMFHTTRKQLELFDDFQKAGLTALLGVGSAPGTTNILARYAYDRLDKVEAVHVSSAGVDLTDTKGTDVFRPPYSIITIMEEFQEEAIEFIDGEYKAFPALSGLEEITYPKPIGQCFCFYTLHSEPATIPDSFKGKGVKEVTWKLGLPTEFVEKAKFLASMGFGSPEPMEVRGIRVVPREVMAAVVNKHIKDKLEGVELDSNIIRARHAQVIGEKNGRKVEYILDCISGVHSHWGVHCATQVPPSIVAQMQAKGMIKEPGVWAPEQVIDPEYFFKELGKREMRVQVMIKEYLT